MKPTYLDAGKLAWYPDIACPVCGGDVNSWDIVLLPTNMKS